MTLIPPLPEFLFQPIHLPVKPILRGLTLCGFYACMIPAGILIDQMQARPARTRRRGEAYDGPPLNYPLIVLAFVSLYGGAFVTWEALDRIDRMKTGIQKPSVWDY